ENGYGKRTAIDEYPLRGRGTKGVSAITQSARNCRVMAAVLVSEDDEVMLITEHGVLERIRVANIREISRATQGVKLIALDEGARLSDVQRIVENDTQGSPAAGNETGSSESGDGGAAAPDAPAPQPSTDI
ncbi:MAG: DNA gyrase subunit A, partial [Ottowia sp.]|nr:DNA gyrase subunit A [Ottowia sp.]